MKTEYFEYLLAIVKFGSINKASTVLMMSQQRLSQIVNELEREFQVQIFYRTPKGIILTTKGKRFVESIQKIMDDIEDLRTEMIKTSTEEKPLSGEIIIYKFPDIAAEYYAQFTNSIMQQHTQINLYTTEASYDTTEQALLNELCDIGIVLLPEDFVNKVPKSLEFIPVLTRQPVVYVHAANTFALKFQSTTLKMLLDKQFVQYAPFNEDDSLVKQLFSHVGEPTVKCSINNLKIFFDYLKGWDYFSIGSVPCHYKQTIPDIITIPLRENITILQGILIKKKDRKNPLISAFIDAYLSFYKPFSQHPKFDKSDKL